MSGRDGGEAAKEHEFDILLKKARYYITVNFALRGDLDAASKLPGLAKEYIEAVRAVVGSGIALQSLAGRMLGEAEEISAWLKKHLHVVSGAAVNDD